MHLNNASARMLDQQSKEPAKHAFWPQCGFLLERNRACDSSVGACEFIFKLPKLIKGGLVVLYTAAGAVKRTIALQCNQHAMLEHPVWIACKVCQGIDTEIRP